MLKRQYLYAITTFFLIPVALIVGGLIFTLINPEIAAGHANYERNYRWIEFLRHSVLLAGFIIAVICWFITCFFLVRAKGQRDEWALLGFLGPVGFILVCVLDDLAPLARDRYQYIVSKMSRFIRTLYEVVVFCAVWPLACLAVGFQQELAILAESLQTGMSREEILNVRNASSGMWAFGEGIEILYLVVLLYLFRPVVCNLMACLIAFRHSSKP